MQARAQFVLRRDIYHRLRVVFAEGFKLARKKVEVVTASGAEPTEVAPEPLRRSNAAPAGLRRAVGR